MELLGNLVFLARDRPEGLSLANSLLHKKDGRSLLQTEAYLTINLSMDDFEDWYTFRGMCVEVFAQLAFDFINNLQFLMEISVDLFDPSIILAQYIGGPIKEVDKHHGSHPIQRLLRLGADPNIRFYKITPLQIASLTGNWIGVRELLQAGAQPNHTGTPDGIARHGCLMYDMDFLLGASPLRICRSFTFKYIDVSRAERQKTEELLLNYGAEDLLLSSCLVPLKLPGRQWSAVLRTD